MSWLRVEDKAAFHAKVVRAGNEAYGAFIRAGAVCSGSDRSGFISFEVAHLIASKKVWKKLLEVGLLDPTDRAGYQIHDFNEYNPTTEQMNEYIEKKRAAGRVGGQRSGEARRSKNEADASKQTGEADEANTKPFHFISSQPISNNPEAGSTANDSDPPKSERRPSRPPPPDPFGATFLVEAWREGVSLATGVPCTPLKPYERSDLDGFVSVHSGGLSGPALREWVRDTAKAFAEASDAKFGFTPKRCAGWLDSGRPGRRDAKQDSSLQKTAGDEPWRANIKVTDL